MADSETLEETWRRGRAALDAARTRLTPAAADDAALAAVIAALERGALSEALAGLADSPHAVRIETELAVAIAARDRVLALARRAFGPGLERMARSFRGNDDPDDDIERAWERVLRNLYTWQQIGEFRAWLSAAFRSSLRDGHRASDRRATRHRRLADEIDRHAPAPTTDKGTTTFGNELALQAFKDSLDPDRRQLWDAWDCLGADGLKPEEIYAALAERHSRSAAAIKGAILRLLAEFKELAGADATGVVDASAVVALWIGSERDGERTTLLSTGIDADDRVRLLAMRRVRQAHARAFTRMFTTLHRWGLPQDRRLLVVADDTPGLRDAIADTFGPRALFQPCLRALLRGVCDGLSTAATRRITTRAEKAYRARTANQAAEQLAALVAELRTPHPSAAQRLAADLDASLTVKRLGLPATLEEQLTRVQFLCDAADAPTGSWLGRLFAGLRERRSVDRRREGLKLLAAALSHA